MDLIPSTPQEWERLHLVNRRLEYLGRPTGINNWHALVSEASRDRSKVIVPAVVDAMSDRQVIAYVRKHGRKNIAIMVDLWQSLDIWEESEYRDGTKMELWRYAAFRIAGHPDDFYGEGSALWMADPQVRVWR